MSDAVDDAVDALAVLGDETRMAILRTLADADEPLPFSTLRERVGVQDSGRFNYHLGELCEYFVRETPSGYELGHAGSRVIDAAAGATDGGAVDAADAATVEAVETDECPVCGDTDCGKLYHVHLSVPWR